MILRLTTSTRFDLAKTARSHGWVYLAPFRWERGTLSWIQRGHLSRSYRVSIEQIASTALRVLPCANPGLTADERRALLAAISRVLNVDLDLSEFRALARRLDPRVARFVSAGGGRLLRGASLFEDLVKTLCTTNAAWSHTENQITRLVSTYGQPGPDGRAFPSPHDLRDASEQDLRTQARMGYRAVFLAALVRKSLDWIDRPDWNDARWLAEGLPGFGPYARAHMDVLLNRFSEVPWDSEVRAYAQEQLGIPVANEVRAKMLLAKRLAPWGDWKFLAFKCQRKLRTAGERMK